MPLLDTWSADLAVGDILLLPDNYDLGPGSGPVDLLVFDPNSSESGLGLMVASGYKADLVYVILPAESRDERTGALSLTWLRANWSRWFSYTYHAEAGPIPFEAARVLAWTDRTIMELPDADSRPA